MAEYDVCVIGGGLLGSAFGWGLVREGQRCVVLDEGDGAIRTARGKGIPERTVVMRHAFRNAILPVVTVTGLSVRNLVAGALFIETIYSWPGMGSLFLDAVLVRDYPMIMGVMLVVAIVVLIANLLTDLTYGAVDPRIRLQGQA